MAVQKKRAYNKKVYSKKKKRQKNVQREHLSLKHSVILMLILLCLFFATRTDVWLTEHTQEVREYLEISLDQGRVLPDGDRLLQRFQDLLSQLTDRGKASIHAEEEMVVHFLDVGQGSACLVASEGHYMLIDGGDRKTSSFVVAYLRDQGVEQLDYVIATHYDADHISGLVGVLNVYPTEKVLCPDYKSDTKTYASLMEKIRNNGSETVHPQVGEKYTLGEAVFTIVAPVKDDYEDVNDRSIGIRLVHGSNSFLMLGDAEMESEADICQGGMQLQSDVYLVSHHGSSSSTTQTLLNRVKPKAAVISVGKDNSYGHPHYQTMERLKNANIALYRTDMQGTVIVSSDGQKMTWNCDPCTDYSAGDT